MHSSTSRRVDDFELISLLGTGSLGKVYKAKEKKTGQYYALKIVSKKKVIQENKSNSIMMEKNILTRFSHPNILKAYSTFQDPISLFFLLQLGKIDLKDAIHRFGRLKLSDALYYFSQAVEAIAYLHSRSIAHGDVKPENFVITETNELLLCDFESCHVFSSPLISPVSRAVSAGSSADSSAEGKIDEKNKTETTPTSEENPFFGTAQFLAPECFLVTENKTGQIEPDNPYSVDKERTPTPQQDVWALGCTLFFLLAGFSPFEKFVGPRVLRNKILSADVSFPEFFDEDSIEIIKFLMQMNANDRPEIHQILSHPIIHQNLQIHKTSTFDPELILRQHHSNAHGVSHGANNSQDHDDDLECTPSIGKCFQSKKIDFF